MNQALAVQQQEMSEWKSPSQVKARVDAIQQLMKEVLKPGTKDNEFSGDYGIIPGTGSKPSLWKSGSEQILAMFQIAVDPIVEDLSTPDCFRYRVTTRLTHSPSGMFLGSGIGEASTDETKYKWRRTYSEKEFNSTDPDRRRKKYSQYKDSNGMWNDKEEMQIRQEPADLANTILKMAKKRSQIDATLTVTGASSMFDQDLEDMTDEQKQAMQERNGKGQRKTKAASDMKCSECNATGGHLPNCSKRQANAAKKSEDVICSDCGKTNGHAPECKHAAPTNVLTKDVLRIDDIEHLLKQADKKGNRDPYVRLKVTPPTGGQFLLYCWHKTPQDYFTPGEVGKVMMCEFSIGKKTDGSEFRSLEKIYELNGIQFVDNKPVQAEEAF